MTQLHLKWSITGPGQEPESGECIIEHAGSPEELTLSKLSEMCQQEVVRQRSG